MTDSPTAAGAASSTMPPPGPPACSMLQESVMSECQRDCSACSVDFSRSFIRQCVLGDGSRAVDNMCTHVAAPPPPTAHVCGVMQLMLIAHCRDECDNCDMESVTSVLGGCTVQGVTQEKGVRDSTPSEVRELTFLVRADRCLPYLSHLSTGYLLHTGWWTSEKDAKLAQKLGQLQPFYRCIPHRNAWGNIQFSGQPNTLLATDGQLN